LSETERLLFYDNEPSQTAPTGMISVERVYAINFGELAEADVLALAALYQALPGFDPSHEPQTWFGSSADAPPFLCASAEPSGLVVVGILPPSDWEAWHLKLITGINAYPVLSLNSDDVPNQAAAR
jgi:hypothetical protein